MVEECWSLNNIGFLWDTGLRSQIQYITGTPQTEREGKDGSLDTIEDGELWAKQTRAPRRKDDQPTSYNCTLEKTEPTAVSLQY